jgi:hypothetical protein
MHLSINGQSYKNATSENLAGLFIASSFVNHDIDIIQLTGITASTPSFILPKKYIKIELPYINIFPYQPSILSSKLNPIVISSFPDHKYNLLGVTPTHTSFIYIGFDSVECFNGVQEYFKLMNIYPTEMVCFVCTNGKLEFFNFHRPTEIKLHYYDLIGDNYVTDSEIIVEYSNKSYKLKSKDSSGFKISELTKEIYKLLELTPGLYPELKLTSAYSPELVYTISH